MTGNDTGTGIAGAHLIALDAERAPVTDVAQSDASGNYQLAIPIVRAADGAPVSENFTLRASAVDYQTFPGGIRQALPIDAATATKQPDLSWAIQSSLTDILLLALPLGEQGNPTVSGTVDAGGDSGGVLVVAEGYHQRSWLQRS